MKNFKLKTFILCLLTSLSAYAQREADVKPDAKSAAMMLGQAAVSRHLRPEHKKVLSYILLGQDYDYRASVIDVSCKLDSNDNTKTCVFMIGVDDLNDDDRGWGTVYKLNVEVDAETNHMLSVEMIMVAG